MHLPQLVRRVFLPFLISGVITALTAAGDDSDCWKEGHVSPDRNRKCPANTQRMNGCCQKCTQCTAGYKKMKMKSGNACNAGCVSCEEGTFRLEGQPQIRCFPCKNCDLFNRVYVIKCGRDRNSQCGGCQTGYYENPAVYESERMHRDCLKCKPDTPDDHCREYFATMPTASVDVINQDFITTPPPTIKYQEPYKQQGRSEEAKGSPQHKGFNVGTYFALTFGCTFLMTIVASAVTLSVLVRRSKPRKKVVPPDAPIVEQRRELLPPPIPMVVVQNQFIETASGGGDAQHGASQTFTNMDRAQENEITIDAEKETLPMESSLFVPTGHS